MNKLDANTMSNFRVSTKKQITQMSNTIDDFRNFFRPEKEKSIFLVDKIIESSLSISEHILQQASIKVSKNLQKEVYILGYPNELTQVLINIINNAKDALLDRPIEQERNIIIGLYIEDKKVHISIEDNAGGIADTIIDNIFNPYFSTKEEKNGTGLGLYMSKMIIEEHMQGFLDVKNTKDGARFVLSFQSEMYK
jgi:signal transduction histidine kinase